MGISIDANSDNVAHTMAGNITTPGSTGAVGDMKKDPAANPNISLQDVSNTRLTVSEQRTLNKAVNRHSDQSVRLEPEEISLNRQAEQTITSPDGSVQITPQYGNNSVK
jgi:hypothetical protein